MQNIIEIELHRDCEPNKHANNAMTIMVLVCTFSIHGHSSCSYMLQLSTWCEFHLISLFDFFILTVESANYCPLLFLFQNSTSLNNAQFSSQDLHPLNSIHLLKALHQRINLPCLFSISAFLWLW